MQTVDHAKGRAAEPIDYAELAKHYNTLQIDGAVVMPKKVYNITLFKQAVARRGLKSELDFQAYNADGKTYVKRLTIQRMEA
jgi:hypothetical protein